MPATVADPNRSLDSEQISPATIAHHTVYENTPNLHQSHICQWGAQPYLVDPLSRLVGKPPLSPWMSADFLPLTQVVNNTNSAIPLTEIFDRVFSDVCNSLGFEVQKQKKRGSGNNRVYRNLKTQPTRTGFMPPVFREWSHSAITQSGRISNSPPHSDTKRPTAPFCCTNGSRAHTRYRVWVLGRALKLTREHLAVAPWTRLTQFLYH